MEMSRLTPDRTAEPVSRDQILRRERGQGNINFPCLADHEQDWQPYPGDQYSCYMCDHTYMKIHLLTAQQTFVLFHHTQLQRYSGFTKINVRTYFRTPFLHHLVLSKVSADPNRWYPTVLFSINNDLR